MGFCRLLFHFTQILNAQHLLEVIRTENIIYSNPNPETIIAVSLNLTDYTFRLLSNENCYYGQRTTINVHFYVRHGFYY